MRIHEQIVLSAIRIRPFRIRTSPALALIACSLFTVLPGAAGPALLAPRSIARLFPGEDAVRKHARALVERGTTVLRADDGARFIVEYAAGGGASYRLILKSPFKRVVGYADVHANWMERSTDPPFGGGHDALRVQGAVSKRYRGLGTALAALAMGISKYVRGDRIFMALSVSGPNVPFYAGMGFGIIRELSGEKGPFALGVNLWKTPLPRINLRRKAPGGRFARLFYAACARSS
jgi:hypothetical protein